VGVNKLGLEMKKTVENIEAVREQSDASDARSKVAEERSIESKQASELTQKQLNQAIKNGNPPEETRQARVNGVTGDTSDLLVYRLDKDYRTHLEKSTEQAYAIQLAQQELNFVSDQLRGSFVNPFMFGAVGDGVTDDFEALKIMFEAVDEYGGGTVVFPYGHTFVSSGELRTNAAGPVTIVGFGAVLKKIGLSEPSDECLIYHTSLTDKGGNTKQYAYNRGLTVTGLTLDGEGFGVGIKFYVAGDLTLNNVNSRQGGLQVALLLSGTNGVNIYSGHLQGTEKTLFCARFEEDSATRNYTSDGTGYNDGIHLWGATLSARLYGWYYSGTSSAGVISWTGGRLLGGSLSISGVYAKKSSLLKVEGVWTEFFERGAIIETDRDTNMSESAILKVKGCLFGQYSGKRADHVIINRCKLATIEDNVFQGYSNERLILHSSQAKSKDYISIDNAVPKATSVSGGTISFNRTNIPTVQPLIMTDQNGNSWYLEFNTVTSDGWNQYRIYEYFRTARQAQGSNKVNGDVVIGKRAVNPDISISNIYSLRSVFDNGAKCYVRNNALQGVPVDQELVENYGGTSLVLENNIYE
jgi:hypothetical protein